MKKAKLRLFRPRIRSRHPSHDILRATHKKLKLLPFKSVIRLGSTTDLGDTASNGGTRVELNTIEAIKNSSSKLRMKTCFTENEVKTASWWIYDNEQFVLQSEVADIQTSKVEDLPYPIIAKKHFGSRGQGNTKIGSVEEMRTFLKETKNLNKYIFEKFHNYAREYRLHVSKDGCFYTCRKMMKRDTPDENKWFRNDANCVWILEDNEAFDKPSNWEEIEGECVKALKAVGLDFGAIDLRVQSATNKHGELRDKPNFIVVEINSAPSFGDVTAVKYAEVLPKLLIDKYELI